MKYKILITDTCLALIEKIPDKKIRRAILNRIEGLSDEPDKQSKMLGELVVAAEFGSWETRLHSTDKEAVLLLEKITLKEKQLFGKKNIVFEPKPRDGNGYRAERLCC